LKHVWDDKKCVHYFSRKPGEGLFRRHRRNGKIKLKSILNGRGYEGMDRILLELWRALSNTAKKNFDFHKRRINFDQLFYSHISTRTSLHGVSFVVALYSVLHRNFVKNAGAKIYVEGIGDFFAIGMLCACNPTSVLSSNIITRAES
jgi:hypothetical protein